MMYIITYFFGTPRLFTNQKNFPLWTSHVTSVGKNIEMSLERNISCVVFKNIGNLAWGLCFKYVV